MSFQEMFAPLTAGEIASAPARRSGVTRGGPTPIVPVPIAAPSIADFHHPRLGAPDVLWAYENEVGLVGYVARWNLVGPDGQPRKEIRPLTYCADGRGGENWSVTGFPLPRPLYRLPELLARPDAPVAVVEGERAADAGAELLPDFVVTTSPHGSRAAATADWSPTRGRTVIIIPDADEAGRAYAEEVRQLVSAAGAVRVIVVDSQRLGSGVVHDGRVEPEARHAPDGWDLADARSEGWTADLLLEQLRPDLDPEPSGPAIDDGPEGVQTEVPGEYVVKDEGVYRRKKSDDGELELQWICSRLDIVARTRDVAAEEHGRLLRWKDADGVVHEWAMPNRLLAGDGTAIREYLLAGGLRMYPSTAAKNALNVYLALSRPKATARSVSRVGWHEPDGVPVFVLPDGTVFGNAGGERVVHQTVGGRAHRFTTGGSSEDWSARIASRCIGNSRLLLSVSAAFAGPLLYLVGAESGGVHLHGHSSKGKTTILAVAGSVWGGGGVRGFIQSWRATDNGLEGDAVAHCDTLLCLDELSESDPRAAAASAYMLSNGRAKSRADRSGEGRPRAEWRLLFLSTGEVTLSERLAEERAGRQARAGQDVRLLNVPIDCRHGHGAFENLHGAERASTFADDLKEAARQNFGWAGRQFVAWLVESRVQVREIVDRHRAAFVDDHLPRGADGQVVRALHRFALIAAAGELAALAGVVPWPAGEASAGVGACFLAWLAARGTPGAVEDARAVAQVRRFFEQHGEARFTPWNGDDPDRPTINRAGFRKTNDDDEVEWLVFPESWKEICAGLDASHVASLGVEAGWVRPDATGSPCSSRRLPKMGTKRVYLVTSAVLQVEGDA